MNVLGRLERVDLREAWADEAGNFTPWLAEEENIRLLGDAIGLELEVQTIEKEVGPFRADILCKDLASDHHVLIENQLERTDHNHLGQLMTYAAGLNAVTIVWIAQRFTEEHRAALDWLNDITVENVNFFGLEVELWRIGDSPVAPKFNIASKPNDWSKTLKASTGSLLPRQERQLAFWTGFAEYLQDNSDLKPAKPVARHYTRYSLGRTGFALSAVTAMWDHDAGSFSGVLRVEFVFRPKAKPHFDAFERDRKLIEKEIGESLEWDNRPDRRHAKVYVRRGADPEDAEQWPEYYEWFRSRLETFTSVFKPRVSNLDVSQFDSEEEDE